MCEAIHRYTTNANSAATCTRAHVLVQVYSEEPAVPPQGDGRSNNSFLDSACVEPVNSVVCIVDCGLRYWCIVRYSLIQMVSGIRGVCCRVAASWLRCNCCSFSGGLTYDFAVMRALECQAGDVGLCTAHQYGLMTMHLMMRCGMLDAASDSGQHNDTGSLGVTHPILAFVQVSIGLRAVASLHNCTQWATFSTFICASTRICI